MTATFTEAEIVERFEPRLQALELAVHELAAVLRARRAERDRLRALDGTEAGR